MDTEAYFRSMEQRYAEAATNRLGCPVSFSHWKDERNGSKRPVFSVPESHKQRARELGLTVA